MNQVEFLIDYRGCFGSKYDSSPYRSGLDKEKIRKYFNDFGIMVSFTPYNKIDLLKDSLNKTIYIHDSIEDSDYYYKSYMEDIVCALEIYGGIIFPGYKYIRAHNNKVFMEMLKSLLVKKNEGQLIFDHFGCYEEFLGKHISLSYPIVIKGAEDAQGRKVRLGRSFKHSKQVVKKLSRSKAGFREFWELGRGIKYNNYLKESKFRKKYIVQEFIPGLKNDWKILVFGSRYYILKRGVPDGDFRASGSKYNYGFGSKADPPDGIFDFAKHIYEQFDVPYISLDIAYYNGIFYLLEFQVVSFGSSTHLKSDCYYSEVKSKWIPIFESLDLEYLYADSLSSFIFKRGYLNESSVR